MRTNLANSAYQSIGDTVRCPQYETVSKNPSEPGHIACPQCGITFAEFKNQGRLGCAHDYTFFKDRLDKLLKKVHGSVKYVGKVPPGYQSTQIHQNELIKLKKRLTKVVKAEEYEEAARIRDRIIELESMIRGSGNTEESDH